MLSNRHFEQEIGNDSLGISPRNVPAALVAGILHLIVAVLILFSSALAQAKNPATFLITERSFQWTTPSPHDEELRPEDRGKLVVNFILREAYETDLARELAALRADSKLTSSEAGKAAWALKGKHIEADVQTLKQHFLSLAKQSASSITENGNTLYSFKNPFAFYRDFVLKAPSDRVRDLALSFLASSSEKWHQSMALLLAGNVQGRRIVKAPPEHATLMLNSSELTPRDLEALKSIAQDLKMRLSESDGVTLIGEGFSYLYAILMLESAASERDPLLRRKFERVKRFMLSQGVLTFGQFAPNTSGWFLHHLNGTNISDPSTDLVSLVTHEGTHGRMGRFAPHLREWMKRRNYVMPYELDGPGGQVTLNDSEFWHQWGGYFKLMDEINAYRAERRSTDKESDAQTIEHLKAGYVHLFGEDGRSVFDALWPIEKFQRTVVDPKTQREELVEIPIAALILSHVRRFNTMTEMEITAYGQRAAASETHAFQENFLRLLQTPRGRSMLRTNSRIRACLETILSKTKSNDLIKRGSEFLGIAPKWYEPPTNPYSTRFKDVVARLEKEIDPTLEGIATSPFVSEQFEQEQVAMLARRAIESEAGTKGEALSYIRVLETVFDKQKIGRALSTKTVEEIRARVQRGERKDSYLLQPGYHHAQPMSHWALETIDRIWAESLFTNTSPYYKFPILSFVLNFTLPEEMPRLRAKVVQILTDKNSSYRQSVLAIKFLSHWDAQNEFLNPAWQYKLLSDLKALNIKPVGYAQQAVIEFIDQTLLPSLSPTKWGNTLSQEPLDSSTRARVLAEIKSLSPDERQKLGWASDYLFDALTTGERESRLLVLHAFLANPIALVNAESRFKHILERSHGNGAEVLEFARHFFEPGFMPGLMPISDSPPLANQPPPRLPPAPRSYRCEKVFG